MESAFGHFLVAMHRHYHCFAPSLIIVDAMTTPGTFVNEPFCFQNLDSLLAVRLTQ